MGLTLCTDYISFAIRYYCPCFNKPPFKEGDTQIIITDSDLADRIRSVQKPINSGLRRGRGVQGFGGEG